MSRDNTETFDGLVVGYGRHTVDNEVAAVVSSNGSVIVKVEIKGVDLPDTASATNGIAYPQAHIIPRGSIFLRATLQVVIAFTGSSSIMDIGLWSRGRSGGEVVDVKDGFWDGGTIGELTTIGEVNVLDGSLLPVADGVTSTAGITANSDVIITAEWETAEFTAGQALLVVEYLPPFGSAGRTLAV